MEYPEMEENETMFRELRFAQPEWIVSEMLSIFLFPLVIWTIAGLCNYGVQKKIWQFNQNTKTLNAFCVYCVALAAFFFTLLRFISNQVAFNFGYSNETEIYCEYSIDISTTLYSITYLCYYSVLWLRLYHLHVRISAIQEVALWKKLTMYLSLVIFTIGLAVTSLQFTTNDDYTNSPRGCVDKTAGSVRQYVILFISFLIVLSGQVLMIFLFLHLFRSQLHGRNSKLIVQIAKRSTFVAIGCAISDITIISLNVFAVPNNVSKHVRLTTFDVNICINLFCILLTFKAWKEILFFAVIKKSTNVGQRSAIATISGVNTPAN